MTDTTSSARNFQRHLNMTRAKGLSLAALIFVVGWGAEAGLNWTKAKFFPDDYQKRAEDIRSKIQVQNNEIRSLTDKMAADLEKLKVGSTDSAALKSFLQDAEKLMNNADRLRPTVAQAADFSSDLALRRDAEKNRLLRQVGYDTGGDFTLNSPEGATLCSEEFGFGITHYSNSSNVNATLNFHGNRKISSNLSAGESLHLNGNEGSVMVTYHGPDRDLGKNNYKFGLVCSPSLFDE